MRKNLIISVFMAFAQFANAIPETRLKTDFENIILPFVKANVTSHLFTGAKNKRVHYIHFHVTSPKGAIVLLPGRGETAYKYSEFIYDLKDHGFDIFILDPRGQGQSDRLLADPVKSHVDSFNHYIDDMSVFMFGAVKPKAYKKVFLVAHSLGGAIAAGFMSHHPNAVTAAFMSAPMFDINTGKYNQQTAEWLAHTLNLFGFGNQYAPGQKPYNPDSKFEDNVAISSEARFHMQKRLLQLRPDLQMGGSTVRWVKESLAFTKVIRSQNNVFKVPTVILQAENDQYVNPKGQQEICTLRSPKFCKIYYVPGSKHELLMEKDFLRDRVMSLLKMFLNHY